MLLGDSDVATFLIPRLRAEIDAKRHMRFENNMLVASSFALYDG